MPKIHEERKYRDQKLAVIGEMRRLSKKDSFVGLRSEGGFPRSPSSQGPTTISQLNHTHIEQECMNLQL